LCYSAVEKAGLTGDEGQIVEFDEVPNKGKNCEQRISSIQGSHSRLCPLIPLDLSRLAHEERWKTAPLQQSADSVSAQQLPLLEDAWVAGQPQADESRRRSNRTEEDGAREARCSKPVAGSPKPVM